MLGLHVVLDDGRPRPRWLPDLSKTRARCGISRPRKYFQRNHSVFLNYSAFRGISSFTPTGYGAIAGTIGSRSNPPETACRCTTIRTLDRNLLLGYECTDRILRQLLRQAPQTTQSRV